MSQPYSGAPDPSTTPYRAGSVPTVADVRALPPFDLGVLASGLLVFIVSFFPYYGAKSSGTKIAGVSFGSVSTSVNAWHSYSTLALLLILAATIVSAAAVLASSSLPTLPVGIRWIAAGLSALGGLLFVLRLFTLSHKSYSFGGVKVSEGVKWGGYLLLLLVLANVACAVISALSSDEQVPWAKRTTTGV